jgi:HSP20 family protein
LSDLLGEFPDRLRGDGWRPAADVFETEMSLVIRLELPGVQGDQVRVNVDGNQLRVSGVRRVPSGSDVRRLHQMEIAFGPFERTIRIAQAFERDSVSAHLEDGFLEVTIPKKGGRQIKVESG